MDDGEWETPLSYQPVVKLDRDGDNWLKLVERRICTLTGAATSTIRWAGPDTYMVTPEPGERLNSSLLAGPALKGRPRCIVTGTGKPRPEDGRLWTQAIKWAVKNLDTTRAFPWRAVIGEHPDQIVGPPQVLMGARRVGAIELKPSETAFQEVRGRFAAFGAGQVSRTFPVQAFGTSQGYDLDAALQVGGYDINLLCSLLSLVGGRLWNIQTQPDLCSPTARERFQFPTTPPGQEHLTTDGPFEEPKALEIDERVEEAWTTLQVNGELARLMLAYHECLRLAQERHHSYSLLAAVGIIESLGTGPELPRCPECKSNPGAAKRFQGALMRVMEEPRARQLAKAYDLRSETAHEAVLHGSEPYADVVTTARFYSTNLTARFEYTVREMQQAARQLLAQELRSARERRVQGVVKGIDR